MTNRDAIGTGRAKGTSKARIARDLRAIRILDERVAGKSLAAIAQAEGISVARVHGIIEEVLKSRQTASVHELRRLEADRLEALQTAVWAAAMRGNLGAIEAALGIMARRAKLLGLDSPTRLQVNEAPYRQESRDALTAKLMALKPRADELISNGKVIEGEVVEVSPNVVVQIEDAQDRPPVPRYDPPELDPLDEDYVQDLYGERGLFSS